VSNPSSSPAPAASTDDDQDLAFLRSLAPAEPNARKRAFTSLLRQIVNDKGGQR
jgi:hypothetical protein